MEKVIPLSELNLINADRTYKKTKHRIFEIDLVRGIIIWGMCVDHFIGNFWYLYPYLFGVSSGSKPEWAIFMQTLSLNGYWLEPWRSLIRYIGLMMLLIICGISCKFSKNNALRGVLVLVAGGLLTGGMFLFSYLTNRTYGVIMATLTCIGLCILIYAGIKKLYVLIYNTIQRHNYNKVTSQENLKIKPYVVDKNPKSWKWWCLAFVLIFFLVTCYIKFNPEWCDFNFSNRTDLWKDGNIFLIFSGWYSPVLSSYEGADGLDTTRKIVLICLGAYQYGSDWLGLFPFVFYTFLGGFLGETVYRNKESVLRVFFYHHRYDENGQDRMLKLNDELNRWCSPIIFPGKHTIWIYFLHQPIIILVMAAIFYACGMELII